MTLKTRDEAMILASSFFLAQAFPAHYADMEQAAIEQWIDDCAWEPLEGYPAGDVYDNIETLADTLWEVSEDSRR